MAPVSFLQGVILPYFGKIRSIWAYFLREGKSSILRGFPEKGRGNGAQFGVILIDVMRSVLEDRFFQWKFSCHRREKNPNLDKN